MRSAYATSEPAPEPRPGPTGMPCSLAQLMKSANDQEVAREPHLDDDVELDLQALVVVLAGLAGRQRCFLQALGQAFARAVAQPRFDGVLARHRERRQGVLAELQLDVAARGQLDGVVDRVGHVGEQLRHLLRRLQVLLFGVVLGPLGIVEHAAGGDAHARFVRFEVVALEEAHVVAGDDRNAARRRGMQGERIERVFAVATGTGQLEVQAFAERAAPVGEPGSRPVRGGRRRPCARPGCGVRPGRTGRRCPRAAIPGAGRRPRLRWPSIQARLSRRDSVR